MAHDQNFLQTFTDTDTIAVAHNLDSGQVLVRVVVGGYAVTDQILSVVVADRNNLTITLNAAATGTAIVQVPEDWRADA